MPIFICKFDKNYEIFLEKEYNYVISNFAEGFNLSTISKIEIVSSLPCLSDGRIVGNNILLSKRLYDLLPILDIELLQENDTFNIAVSTLYHELCHFNERMTMSNIHAICDRDDIDIDYFVAQFWIEYIVETKTYVVFRRDKSQFCNDIASCEWSISKFDFETDNTSNYFYLIKVLPYVLAYCHNEKNAAYIEQIKNNTLKDMVLELYDAISKIQKLYPFDDMDNLYEIKRIFLFYKKQFLEQNIQKSNL